MFLEGEGATAGDYLIFFLNSSLAKSEMLAIMGLGAILVRASLFFFNISLANSLDFYIILLIRSLFLARTYPGVFLFSLSSFEIFRRVFPKEAAITFRIADSCTENDTGLLRGMFGQMFMFSLVTAGALLRYRSARTAL